MVGNIIDISEQNLPASPIDEIPRDSQIRQIADNFSPQCQQQMVVGLPQTGKTNLLAQFGRQYKGRCISYFITANPWTQRQHTYLYSLCTQLSGLIQSKQIPENIKLEDLKNLFSTLVIKFTPLAKTRHTHFYFVIDGLDWGMSGTEGDRIIDLFPPKTSIHSPYLLFSCKPNTVSILPDHIRCKQIEPMSFTHLETHKYFEGTNLTSSEIDSIHNKYKGIPGYLKIIKDFRIANQNFPLTTAPAELDSLISQQVESVLSASDKSTQEALELLATAPSSLPLSILMELTQSEGSNLLQSLNDTFLITHDSLSNRLEIANEITQEAIKKKIGIRVKEYRARLIEVIKAKHPDEDFLLTLLLNENQDYLGLQSLVAPQSVLNSIGATGDISSVIKKLQLVSELATQKEDTDGLVKWTLNIAAAKSFISHTANQNEIRALISIGETRKALQNAYGIPEKASRIRLLARVYASMKENRETVTKEAREELRGLVEELNFEDFDKQILQEIAVDLFPILPDVAISILEKTIQRSERQSIVDSAMEVKTAGLGDQGESRVATSLGEKKELKYAVRFLPTWLRKLTFPKLVHELKSVESTKAKDYMIRQWCRQNAKSSEIVKAVDLWLDTVISDGNFVVLLRSLRQISNVVVRVPITEKKRLVDRLQIPGFTSLDSPREEWVRFRLNLAEALFEVDSQNAIDIIDIVQQTILDSITELDTKAFCLARLRATTGRVIPNDLSRIRNISSHFQESLNSLLKHSASQLELTRGVIQTLVEIDPTEAILVAMDLNTVDRRVAAMHIILETTLRRRGAEDVSDCIKQVLEQLEQRDRDTILTNVIIGINDREFTLATPTLDALLSYSEAIQSFYLKAKALGSLAVMFRKVSPSTASKVMEEAIESWKQVDDLMARIALGFELVEEISKLDLDRARALCDEVQTLQLLPGSALATGELGAAFRGSLDLAIRSITLKSVTQSDELLRKLETLITYIPARIVRLRLKANLAANACRIDYGNYAKKIVSREIIKEIENLGQSLERADAIAFSLPIIFEYDPSSAKKLSNSLSYRTSDRAWYSVVLWSLTRSFLGDYNIDPEKLRVSSDYPRFLKVIDAISSIHSDLAVYGAISATTRATEVSFESNDITLTQSLEILRQLDELAESKLPEPGNRSIKHKGYRILAQATIHRARSIISHREKRERGPSQKDISQKWQTICLDAENIENVADRVLVLATVAAELARQDQKDHSRATNLLALADKQINDIPDLIDRIDRLETIAESWRLLGEKTPAEFALRKAMELISQMKDVSSEDRLRLIAQTAYKLDPDFADDLISKLDSGMPTFTKARTDATLQIEKLVQNPARITAMEIPRDTSDEILIESSTMLLEEFASGRGTVPSISVLHNWLNKSSRYSPAVTFGIMEWVIESLHRKSDKSPDQSRLVAMLEVADLIHQLALRISPAHGAGIPDLLQDNFPGLSSKFEVFRSGEEDRAKKWLQDWLSENAKGYLKICDPYFSTEGFNYLRYVHLVHL